MKLFARFRLSALRVISFKSDVSENFIEEQIKKAVEAGEFDNSEGVGKPLDLKGYFNMPEDMRVGYSVLKSSRFVPEEVDRLKKIGELKERVRSCADEKQKKDSAKILNEKQLAFDLNIERNRKGRR